MTAPDYVPTAPTGWWVKAPLGLLNYSDDFNRAVLGPNWAQRNGTYNMVLRDNEIAYCADTAEDSTAVISWVHHLNVDDIMVKGVTAERSDAQTNVALGIGGSDKVGWANTNNNTYYSLYTSTNWDSWGAGIIVREEDSFADFTAGIDVMLSLERIGTLFVVRANGFIYQYWDDGDGYVPLDDTHRYVMCGVTHPQAGSNAGGWTSFGVTETPQSRPNWLMADWGGYSDDFNRADTQQLGWWWYDQSVNRLGLVDNQLCRPEFGGAGTGTVMWPGATTFADLEVTFTAAAAPASGEQIIVGLGSHATGKGVAAYIGDGSCFIGTATNSIDWDTGQSNRSGSYSGTVADGDTFTFRREATVYTLDQNGTARCTWDDSAGYIPIDRFHVFQKIAIYKNAAGVSTARVDDWSWTELDSDRIMPTGYTAHYADDFNRADSTTGLGNGWTARHGITGVNGNAAYPVTTSDYSFSIYNYPMGTNNHQIGVTVGSNQSSARAVYLLLGCSFAGEGAWADLGSDGTWTIYSITGWGSWISRANAGGQSRTSGDVVDFRRNGNVYTLHKNNGAAVVTWTDSGDVVPRGSDHRRVGCGSWNEADTYTRIDAFAADDI